MFLLFTAVEEEFEKWRMACGFIFDGLWLYL